MTIEEKAKRYDEAVINGSRLWESDIITRENYEYIFPELKESEDERIRKALINGVEYCKASGWTNFGNNVDIDVVLAWLEKQGKKVEPIEGFSSEFERQISQLIASIINKEYEYTEAFVKWTSDAFLNYAKRELEKQGERKLCMIQWKGDNLKEVVNFTGKDKNFDKWFKSFEEYEKYVHGHNDIFKLFNEDGSHYEVPVGAWIVKTPDGYNVASKAVFNNKSAEWSEEDKKLIDDTCHLINTLASGYGEKVTEPITFSGTQMIASIKDRLRALVDDRPQNRWKPSEEQMDALNNMRFAVEHFGPSASLAALDDLYNQLEKLMEE